MWFLSWADVFWQLFLDCDWVISQGRQIVHINRIARHEEFISNEIAQKCSLLTEEPNNRLTPTNRSSWVAIHTHPPDLVRLLYTGSSKVAIHQIWCTCYSRTIRSTQPDLVGQGPCLVPAHQSDIWSGIPWMEGRNCWNIWYNRNIIWYLITQPAITSHTICWCNFHIKSPNVMC